MIWLRQIRSIFKIKGKIPSSSKDDRLLQAWMRRAEVEGLKEGLEVWFY